ncbi:hypothetical protein AB0G60_30260 [Streptomyces angustmyceticus]|uniref:Integral membrane protein n=1 Tax=Streptomyces angustmyceticus TaxID=285578 RepID=A0A5J4LGL9_9ACTN|nr:hypothetical protein [Streptomyces angustmyceticus]UAL70850.1 hypothetical protein K7396_33345 [Streptomyces angustmyceticus]GES29808.1 hypothetical protein San01_22950 [Streptomyces angustmyceticus]
MAKLAFLILAFGPVLAPCVFVVAATALSLRAYRRLPGRGWRLPSVATCALVAVMAGAAAFGGYAWGVMSGFYILDPDQMCAAQVVRGDHIETRETLPVSARCVTSDGVASELVPGWVNPLIYLGLTLLVAALVTGVLAGLRRRTGRR